MLPAANIVSSVEMNCWRRVEPKPPDGASNCVPAACSRLSSLKRSRSGWPRLDRETSCTSSSPEGAKHGVNTKRTQHVSDQRAIGGPAR
jgi:hypothetical protein